MPTPIRPPEFVPGLHQSLRKQRVKILLKIAFISNQSPELACFPSLFDRVECGVVKEAVDVPVWITQPVDRSGIPMEELGIQQLAGSAIPVHASAWLQILFVPSQFIVFGATFRLSMK